jgi:hypothetical protein
LNGQILKLALIALEKNSVVRNPGAQIFNGRLTALSVIQVRRFSMGVSAFRGFSVITRIFFFILNTSAKCNL